MDTVKQSFAAIFGSVLLASCIASPQVNDMPMEEEEEAEPDAADDGEEMALFAAPAPLHHVGWTQSVADRQVGAGAEPVHRPGYMRGVSPARHHCSRVFDLQRRARSVLWKVV